MNPKFLTDSEILKWNSRLEDTDYSVFPVQTPASSDCFIVFRQKIATKFNSPYVGDQFVETVDPFVRYQFTFSVSKNRIDFFQEILDKLMSQPFGTKSLYREYIKNGNSPSEKYLDISLSEKIIDSKSSVSHKIFEKEYQRFTYNFAGKLSSIIAYVSYLEDAIEYLSLIWGYDQDGKETCLLKFPIGSVVSKINQTNDYLVLDYSYNKLDGKYSINYICAEIFNTNGTAIKYGQVSTMFEKDLKFSRDFRINDILNN